MNIWKRTAKSMEAVQVNLILPTEFHDESGRRLLQKECTVSYRLAISSLRELPKLKSFLDERFGLPTNYRNKGSWLIPTSLEIWLQHGIDRAEFEERLGSALCDFQDGQREVTFN